MLCSWEGNRRSSVTLAMRHRLSGLSTYGFNVRDMSTLPMPQGMAPFILPKSTVDTPKTLCKCLRGLHSMLETPEHCLQAEKSVFANDEVT